MRFRLVASVAAVLFFSSAAMAASPPCKCEWHPANSSVNADATCYVDEDKRSDCRLDWRLKGTSSPVPPTDVRSDDQLINSISDSVRRVRVSPQGRASIEPMGRPEFWFQLRSDIRKLTPVGEGPLFDYALDFLSDPGLMKAEQRLVTPALAYVTYALIRRRTPDDDRLSPTERSLNAVQRQRFTDALFGQLERLAAFDGRRPPDKFLDEGKGDPLPEGKLLYINVMGRIGPGCFEIWSDQEVAGAFMVKASWSPIRVGRCG